MDDIQSYLSHVAGGALLPPPIVSTSSNITFTLEIGSAPLDLDRLTNFVFSYSCVVKPAQINLVNITVDNPVEYGSFQGGTTHNVGDFSTYILPVYSSLGTAHLKMYTNDYFAVYIKEILTGDFNTVSNYLIDPLPWNDFDHYFVTPPRAELDIDPFDTSDFTNIDPIEYIIVIVQSLSFMPSNFKLTCAQYSFEQGGDLTELMLVETSTTVPNFYNIFTTVVIDVQTAEQSDMAVNVMWNKNEIELSNANPALLMQTALEERANSSSLYDLRIFLSKCKQTSIEQCTADFDGPFLFDYDYVSEPTPLVDLEGAYSVAIVNVPKEELKQGLWYIGVLSTIPFIKGDFNQSVSNGSSIVTLEHSRHCTTAQFLIGLVPNQEGTIFVGGMGDNNDTYVDNSYCHWRILAREDTYVILVTNWYNTEYTYDFVYIYVDDFLVWRFTGAVLPPSLVYPKGSRVEIEFDSDDSNVEMGFEMQYTGVSDVILEKVVDLGKVQQAIETIYGSYQGSFSTFGSYQTFFMEVDTLVADLVVRVETDQPDIQLGVYIQNCTDDNLNCTTDILSTFITYSSQAPYVIVIPVDPLYISDPASIYGDYDLYLNPGLWQVAILSLSKQPFDFTLNYAQYNLSTCSYPPFIDPSHPPPIPPISEIPNGGVLNMTTLTCECGGGRGLGDKIIGLDCSVHLCPQNCSGENGVCDEKSGTCSCADSFYGDNCTFVYCPGNNNCYNHGECSSFNGVCSCYIGYTGSDCNTCSSQYIRDPATKECVFDLTSVQSPLQLLSVQIYWAMSSISVVGIIYVLICLSLIIWMRNDPIVAQRGLTWNFLICVGSIISFSTVLISGSSALETGPLNLGCALKPWVFGLGFMLSYSTLFSGKLLSFIDTKLANSKKLFRDSNAVLKIETLNESEEMPKWNSSTKSTELSTVPTRRSVVENNFVLSSSDSVKKSSSSTSFINNNNSNNNSKNEDDILLPTGYSLRVLKVVLGLTSIEALIVLLWTFIDREHLIPGLGYEDANSSSALSSLNGGACTSRYETIWIVLLIFYPVVVGLLGLIIEYRIRSLPKARSSSNLVGYSIYNTLFTGAVLLPLRFFVASTISSRFVIESIGYIFGTGFTLSTTIFFPIVLRIREKCMSADIEKKLEEHENEEEDTKKMKKQTSVCISDGVNTKKRN
eukprot:TRINITY_DN5317_c0_g1_i2.p1 TRINITY_DN5317_c0_g1~~TRINITY_DN5317_c0_g1_i2.p1  ORF type:complete len:1314 (-),score=264.02 TRINITY_DN5317_c0_g1_i2:6-3512(-)